MTEKLASVDGGEGGLACEVWEASRRQFARTDSICCITLDHLERGSLKGYNPAFCSAVSNFSVNIESVSCHVGFEYTIVTTRRPRPFYGAVRMQSQLSSRIKCAIELSVVGTAPEIMSKGEIL